MKESRLGGSSTTTVIAVPRAFGLFSASGIPPLPFARCLLFLVVMTAAASVEAAGDPFVPTTAAATATEWFSGRAKSSDQQTVPAAWSDSPCWVPGAARSSTPVRLVFDAGPAAMDWTTPSVLPPNPGVLPGPSLFALISQTPAFPLRL